MKKSSTEIVLNRILNKNKPLSRGIEIRYLLLLFISINFTLFSKAQTVLYATNFGTVANVNPVGWTFSGVDMNISTNTTSSGYAGVSGGAYLGEGNSVAFTNTSGIAEPSSQIGTSTATFVANTVGYNTITISFGMRKSSAGYNANATYTFEWSSDGSTYTPISYTEATAGGWGLASGSGLTLPSGADNQPTLYLRWTFNRTGTASNYKIDDFSVSGNSLIVNSLPTIVMNVATTNNYLDGGVIVPPISPAGISGVISDPSDPASTYGIDFTINDLETPVGSLIVTAVSANTTVVPSANIILTGSGASRNLKMTPAAVGYSNITISVNDGTASTSYIIYYAASIASTTPVNTFWHTGMSDASDAIAQDDNFYMSGDDELDVLNVYSRSASGLPLASFNYASYLSLPDPVKPEVDLEAATVSVANANRVYWLGSMSNGSAPSFSDKPNRNRIFATTTSGVGAATSFSFVGYYGNLKAELISWGDANGYDFTSSAAIGVDSKSVNGFAAEGMVFAPDNTTLYIGMRAPLVPMATRTKAVIAPIINFETWFNGGAPASAAVFGTPIELDLGGRGFRDLTRLSNGTYVIVAGNSGSSPITSAIFKWTGNPSDAPILVSTSADAVLNMEGVMQINTGGHISLNDLQVITDGGSEILYADGMEAKSFSDLNLRKFRSDNLNSIDLCITSLGDTTAVACNNFMWHGTNYISSATPTHLYTAFSGCDSIVTLHLTVNPLPSATVSVVGTTSFCLGDSVLLTSSVGATYQWVLNGSIIAGATSNTYNALLPGNYTVLLSNGTCSATSANTSVIVNPLPSTPVITQIGAVLTSTSASSYQWYLNGVAISGATAQNYTVTANGTYTVVVSNTFGCESTSAPLIITTTGIADASNNNLINVFPNPYSESTSIDIVLSENAKVIVEVYSVLGEKIKTLVCSDLTSGKHSFSFGAKQLGYSSGIYFVNVSINNEVKVLRIIEKD